MEKGFILSLIIAAIVALFALNNSAKVLIDLFFTEVEISQAIIILGSTLFGAIIAAIMGGVRSLKLKKEIRHLNKIVSDSDDQLKLSYESLEDEKKKLESLVNTLEEDKENLKKLVETQKLEKNVESKD
ncbi:MAG TPA: LapA family protein [Tissierellaceae bacterium]|nr:LapA family protein [Tissierellaceae bacterium]